MNIPGRSIIILFFVLLFNDANAQSGGPPMITDDPGVVSLHHFEINTAFLSSITKDIQLSVPSIDACYGLAKNLQLKAEMPYLLTMNKHERTTGSFGVLSVGLKFRFMGEETHYVSAGIYPQYALTGDKKGLLFPLLIEKTFNKFVIGEDFGCFIGQKNNHSLQNGLLIGYKASRNFELMGEMFIQRDLGDQPATNGFMNYGFRYTLNTNFKIMGSLGTQVITPTGEQKQYFISYLGLQSSF
ncbi:MAG: hypothetical protein WCH29_10260 [Chitinophagaceae bacterium]